MDLEDVEAACLHLSTGRWCGVGESFGHQVKTLLGLLEQHRIRATFFTVAGLARQEPTTMQLIARMGHEIACHGLVHERTPDCAVEFRAQAKTARAILQDITGQPILGYRAPHFSIEAAALWKLLILKEEGYAYDSSMGSTEWQTAQRAQGYANANDLPIEMPVYELPGGLKPRRVGGGHLAALSPWAFTRIRRALDASADPKVIYMHPYNLGGNRISANSPVSSLIKMRHLYVHNFLSPLFRARVKALLAGHLWQPLGDIAGV